MAPRLITIAQAMVDCIADGREPSVHELADVADRIARELTGGRSAFAWGGPADDSSIRLISLRVAQAALTGSGPGLRRP